MSDPVTQRPSRIVVDLSAVGDNLRAIRAHVGVPVMGIVKANAYGHGLVPVARHLEACGVDRLGVAFVEEGIALRRAGIRLPILVLGGIFGPQVADYLRHDLEIALATPVVDFQKTESPLGIASGANPSLDYYLFPRRFRTARFVHQDPIHSRIPRLLGG